MADKNSEVEGLVNISCWVYMSTYIKKKTSEIAKNYTFQGPKYRKILPTRFERTCAALYRHFRSQNQMLNILLTEKKEEKKAGKKMGRSIFSHTDRKHYSHRQVPERGLRV